VKCANYLQDLCVQGKAALTCMKTSTQSVDRSAIIAPVLAYPDSPEHTAYRPFIHRLYMTKLVTIDTDNGQCVRFIFKIHKGHVERRRDFHKKHSLYRYCLSTMGGFCPGGFCPTANHLIFGGILSGGIMSGIHPVQHLWDGQRVACSAGQYTQAPFHVTLAYKSSQVKLPLIRK